MISKGMPAPDLSLFDSTKHLTVLSELRNKKNVLLLFFPLAFTSTCTTELCAVRDDVSTYRNEKTEVFGISVDSAYTLAAYKDSYHLNYPLLSDFNRVASKDYQVLYDHFTVMKLQGVSKRAAFIIDKAGMLQYTEILEDANEVPDFKVIKQILQFLA